MLPRVAVIAPELKGEVEWRDADAVVIVAPREENAQRIIEFIEHGKAVFAKLPIGRDWHDTQMVVDVARGNCLLLGVDLAWRHLKLAGAVNEVEITTPGEKLYDAVDLALSMFHYPRVLRADISRIELAGNSTIRINDGQNAKVVVDRGKPIHLDTSVSPAFDDWVARLSKSTEFDESIETIVDVARAIDAMSSRA